jgi:hypothetical protein
MRNLKLLIKYATSNLLIKYLASTQNMLVAVYRRFDIDNWYDLQGSGSI